MTGERSEPENFEMRIQIKNTPDNAKNLEMLFSEIYILKIPGGGGAADPPTPPLDPCLNPPNQNFLDNILYTGTALYGQIVNTNNIHGYLGHNHLSDSVSLRGSNSIYLIHCMLDDYNVRNCSRKVSPPLGGYLIVITVCQSVSKIFNIDHYFCTVRGRTFIFYMSVYMTFPLVPNVLIM